VFAQRAIHELAAAAGVADLGRPRVDPDAEAQGMADEPCQVAFSAGNSPSMAQGGATRPGRVVLEPRGGVPHGQEAVRVGRW